MNTDNVHPPLGTRSLAERLAIAAAVVNAWQPMTYRYRNADTYVSRRPAHVNPLPLLTAHQAAHKGYFPDAMTDTPRRRKRRAPALKRQLHELHGLYPSGLVMVTVHLRHLDGLPLYSEQLAAEAHAAAAALLKAAGLRGVWKVERGREGGTHVHLVTASAAKVVKTEIFDDNHVVDVSDGDGLAEYLSKPGDAAVCRPDAGALAGWGQSELDAMRAFAAEEYLAARAALPPGKKLPRMIRNNFD
jgi:hypothetical protein